jgi:RimJ/RimL family protein N-acetyltransferase
LKNIEIQTERLILAPLDINDKIFILELVNTGGWLEFIGDRNVHSQEDAAAYIKKILSQSNISYWVVRDKFKNIPLGIITFIQRDYLEDPDIGFAFLPQYYSKGYAGEATKAILELVFNDQKIFRILAITKAHNYRSITLLLKLGFTKLEEKNVDDELMEIYQLENATFK